MLFRLLILLPAVFGIPLLEAAISTLAERHQSGFDLLNLPQGCSTSGIPVPVPKGLSVPSGQNTSLITVGRGVQNYTCTKGVYLNIGALAK